MRDNGSILNGERLAAASAMGSIGTAVLASACCWLPLLLMAFGVSAAGVGAVFEPWRPYFAAGAVVFLGMGFFLAYRRPRACGGGSCCGAGVQRRRRMMRVGLWIAALVVAASILFPKYAGALWYDTVRGTDTDGASASVASQTLVFEVQGMTCELCAVKLRAALLDIESVHTAEVDYHQKTARVQASGGGVAGAVEKAAERLGYTAVPAKRTAENAGTRENTHGDTTD